MGCIVTQFARERFGIYCIRGSCKREYDLGSVYMVSAPFTVRP